MGFFSKLFGGRESGTPENTEDPGSAWDRAEWYFDGEEVGFESASRHIYFVLEWLDGKKLLTDTGRAWLADRENLDVGLYREDVTPEAARFLDQHYKGWFEDRHIINYQIDSDLAFDGDEGLGALWAAFHRP